MQRMSFGDFCKRSCVMSEHRERTPTDLILRGLDYFISMLIATSSTELKRTEKRERERGISLRALRYSFKVKNKMCTIDLGM